MDENQIAALCDSFFSNADPKNKEQMNIQLNQIKDDPDAWRVSRGLIEGNHSDYAKAYGFQLISNAVKTYWGNISPEEREDVRNFVATVLINWSENNICKLAQPYCSQALARIIIRDWPQEWPTVVNDMIDNALSNTNLLNVILTLLRDISTDVKDFSQGAITTSRISQLNRALLEVTPKILELLGEVFNVDRGVDITRTAMQCFGSVVKWLDPSGFYNSNLLEILTQHYLPNPAYQEDILTILAEFANNEATKKDANALKVIPPLFKIIMESIGEPQANDQEFFINLYFEEQNRVQAIINMLYAFMSNYLTTIEAADLIIPLAVGFQWTNGFLSVVQPQTDCFKNIVELWNVVARHYHYESHNRSIELNEMYMEFIHQAQYVLIWNIQRPPQINIDVENEGNYVVKATNDAESQLYNLMHETLVIMTNISPQQTIDTIYAMFEALVDEQNPVQNPNLHLTKICWATGAVSGAIPQEKEKRFIIDVLTKLLHLFEGADESNKVLLGSGVLFVSSQYPKFLCQYQPIFTLIIEKTVQFMHESIEGIKEVAVSAFRTIAESCKRAFVQSRGQDRSMFEELIANVPSTVSALEEESPVHAIKFYDAMSIIITAIPNEGERATAVGALMENINERWESFSQSFDVGSEQDVEIMTYLLRYNAVVANNVGIAFHLQFQHLFQTILFLYNAVATRAIVECNGDDNNKLATNLRQCLSAITSVIGNFCENLNGNILQYIKTTVIPQCNEQIGLSFIKTFEPLQNLTSGDFTAVNVCACVPEVIKMYTSFIKCIKQAANPYLDDIYERIFNPTVTIVRGDENNTLLFRQPLMDLASAMIQHCYTWIFNIEERIQSFIESIVICSHARQYEISTSGLKNMADLYKKLNNSATVQYKGAFCQQYYLDTVKMTFEIMTDTEHKFAFKEEVELLRSLFLMQIDQRDPVQITMQLTELMPNKEPKWILAQIDSFLKMKEKQDLSNAVADFLIDIKEFMPYVKELDLEALEQQLRSHQEDLNNFEGFSGPRQVNEDDVNNMVMDINQM